MNDAPNVSITPTCGNCRFGQTIKDDLAVVECHGLPPTPGAIPGPQGMAVIMMRARLPRTHHACALHQPHKTVLLGAAS